MIARITTDAGDVFHLRWRDGKVVADSGASIAAQCTDYLNGTPTLYLGEPNEGGTDGHYTEQRPLRTEDEFMLTVGSLTDRFNVRVNLVGELSDTEHEEILSNPAADAEVAKIAIERAVRHGMSREQAVRLYGVEGE